MYGLSINYRGDYKNKEKYLRGVQLNDHNKNRVGLPLNLKSLVQERIAELEPSINSLANHFKIGKVDTLYFLDNLIKQITDDFKSLDIISLNSQLHLGEFIEFKLNNDCIIWYKKEGDKLNSTYRVLFNEAQEIRKNWFIINPDDQCLQ